MRPLAVLIVLLLTACGGAVQSPGGLAEASTAVEPSVAVASEAALPSAASESAPPGSGLLTAVPLEDGDASQGMGYLEYLPPSYAADGEASPLLIFLHGGGEAGVGSEESLELVDDLGLTQLIASSDWPMAQPFVVLAPQYGLREANGRCDFGEDLDRFIEWALGRYNVHHGRVYLTGVSCGAIGIWDYLASHGGEVAAAFVPISGHAMWAMEEAGCGPLAEVPVWAFHGADDDIVPVSFVEDQIDEIGACEGAGAPDTELTVYPDTGHVEAIAPTYDGSAGHDIFAWMLKRVNERQP